jgi:hypothetical protein
MPASFPASVKSFGADRVNGDYIPAADTNDLRAEVVAVETALLPMYSDYTSGGWSLDSNTWTYLSASTFTLPGDKTAIFTKGLRLRFKQGAGFKYAVVLSSAFTSVTTVTIVVNTDFTIANAAITENGYSYLTDPRGWPGWFNYTPTFAGFSANPGGVIAKYNIRGTTCYVVHVEQSPGTSNATSFTVTLPVNSAEVTRFGLARTMDNGVAAALGQGALTVGSAVATLTKSTGAVWTGTGTKSADFEMFYQI